MERVWSVVVVIHDIHMGVDTGISKIRIIRIIIIVEGACVLLYYIYMYVHVHVCTCTCMSLYSYINAP